MFGVYVCAGVKIITQQVQPSKILPKPSSVALSSSSSSPIMVVSSNGAIMTTKLVTQPTGEWSETQQRTPCKTKSHPGYKHLLKVSLNHWIYVSMQLPRPPIRDPLLAPASAPEYQPPVVGRPTSRPPVAASSQWCPSLWPLWVGRSSAVTSSLVSRWFTLNRSIIAVILHNLHILLRSVMVWSNIVFPLLQARRLRSPPSPWPPSQMSLWFRKPQEKERPSKDFLARMWSPRFWMLGSVKHCLWFLNTVK